MYDAVRCYPDEQKRADFGILQIVVTTRMHKMSFLYQCADSVGLISTVFTKGTSSY